MTSFRCVSFVVLLSQIAAAEVDFRVARGELADALVTDDECCGGTGDTTCALGLAQLRAGRAETAPNADKKNALQPKVKSNHKQEVEHKVNHKHRVNHKDKAKQKTEHVRKAEHKNKVAVKEESGHKEPALPDYQHPAWVKNCNKIFLDLGSHIGVNVRKFYEPKRYPGAKLVRYFDESIGSSGWRRVPANKTGVCVLGFEPNPKHSPRLQRLEEAYVAQGWHVHFYPLAAWSSEGNITLSDSDSSGVVTGKSDIDDGETVRTADLAKFIQTLPPNSVKLMVMDINGAEYETLARLMQQSILCNSTIEKALVGANDYGDTKHWGGHKSFVDGTDPRSFAAIEERVKQLAGVKWCADDTVTQVQEFDDDTYTKDVDDAFGKSPAEIKRLAMKNNKPPVAFMAEVADEKYPEKKLIIQIGEASSV